MTRFDPRGTIAGLPALDVRRLLRIVGPDPTNLEYIAHRLRVDEPTARGQLDALAAAGYLARSDRRPDRPLWECTIRGNALRMASAAKPIARATADRLLAGFVARARELEARTELLHHVEFALVFGSYLRPDVERLGDVDVALRLVRKIDDGAEFMARARAMIADAEQRGRQFRSLFESMLWPETSVLQFLRGGSRALSLHQLDAEDLAARPEWIDPARAIYGRAPW